MRWPLHRTHLNRELPNKAMPTKKRSPKPGRNREVTLSQLFVLDQSSGENPERVWVQIAAEGEFKGYAGGELQFTFDTRVFEQIVANFHRHPAYRKGDDGYGCANVVGWDFHHASEMPATEGTIPATGAPAQGWIHELAVRHNAQGKAELWALTKWLEPAKTYIKEERYQWASVSVVFDAVDPRSGLVVGPVLTSVALTNTPFIEGMNKLAAGRYVRSRDMYIEAADSPERALEMIRAMLGMPETADAAAVVGELEKVKQWVAAGQTPLGVDIEEIVGGLRTVLNLPSLATPEEVFVEVDKLTSRLLGTNGAESAPPTAPVGMPDGGTPPPPPDMPPASTLENTNMDLLKVLSEKLGVVAKPEVVAECVDALLQLQHAAAKNVGLENTASTKVVLKATLDDSAVRAKYGPVLSALGVEDPDAAMDKIAKLMQESEELKSVAPEFASLKQRMAEIEEQEEEEEVEAAAASAGVTASSEHYEGLKVALSHLRKNNRDEFAKRYPKEKLDKGRAALGRLGGADTSRLTSMTTATTVTASKAGATGGSPDTTQPAGQIDVSTYQGANTILRTCSYVKASVQGAKDWSWERVHEHATKLVKSGVVTG